MGSGVSCLWSVSLFAPFLTWIFSEGGLEREGASGAGMLNQLYGANVQQFVSDAYDKEKLLPKTVNHVPFGLLDLISIIIQSFQLVSGRHRCSTLYINYIGSGQS